MSNATEIQLEHWTEDRSGEVIAVHVVCLVALFVAVTLRFYAQSLVVSPWKYADNWLALAAAVFATGVAGCMLKALDHGFGKHTLRIIAEDPVAPYNLATIFMYGYVISILQTLCITCTKLSILSLYARVFGMLHHDTFFIYGVYVCTAVCILLGVGNTFVFILQCIPAPVFWNRIYLMFPGVPANGPTEGYCMDQVAHVVVPVALDLVTEIAIMLLPSRLLWNLQLPLKKKIGLTITFSLGIFVSATNIVRIVYYARIINGGDLAWDDIDALIWTIVCMCFAVVCSSIPPCAPLLKVWSRKTRSDHGYSGSVPLTDRSENTSRQSGRSAGKREPSGGLIISRNDEWMVDSESVGGDGEDLYNSTHGVDRRWNSRST